MGLFGTKKISCPANQWTTLVSNFAAGMPKTWDITFTTIDGSMVAGIFEEKRALWIFPQSPVRGELREKMQFERYWINAIYSIKIYPATDVVAEID
jgi:hypothetical protein